MMVLGFLDNPGESWLRIVLEKAHRTELELRTSARTGMALSPGGRGRHETSAALGASDTVHDVAYDSSRRNVVRNAGWTQANDLVFRER